jgi:hypothetical protein
MTAIFGAGREARNVTEFSSQRPSSDRQAGAAPRCRACGAEVPVLIFFDTRRQAYCRPACWEAMSDR